MHAKYEVSISYISKVIAKVKVDNRQTDKQTDGQTDRQDKNNMPPIIRSGGMKNFIVETEDSVHVQCSYHMKPNQQDNTFSLASSPTPHLSMMPLLTLTSEINYQ